MKQLAAIFVFILFISGCALTPHEVRTAPDRQTQAVIFDIDGTLTPDVTSIFKVRPYAAQSVQLYADKGYEIIYLSARIKLLQSKIPGWLEKHHFPEGSIHLPETAEDGKDHATFKANVLKDYVANGWTLAFAYGDSSTDFEAYADAGIPMGHVFALQRKGDDVCQPGTYQKCLVSWEEHLDFIKKVPVSK